MNTTDMYIRVAVFAPLRQLFDYEAKDPCLSRGCRVYVPLGRRKLVGIVVETDIQPDYDLKKIKPIIDIIDKKPILTESVLKLCEFASQYYHHPLGETLSTALPSLLRSPIDLAAPFFWSRSNTEASKLTKAQSRCLSLIDNGIQNSDQLSDAGISLKTLEALENQGLIEKQNLTSSSVLKSTVSHLSLNEDQTKAYETIQKTLDTFHIYLLEGVTGSGKTEVYLQLCHDVLQSNGQVLIIVPEISLTPQLVERFEQRFGRGVCASLHSGLNPQTKLAIWNQTKSGFYRIIIGTRSSVFAEFKDLKLIIIDEEHDSSLKQQDGLKYSARDLACVRAKNENINLVLGSATPSLEALANVKAGRYTALPLRKRATESKPPRWLLIDLRKERTESGLSARLIEAIKSKLEKNEQVLIFLNRRGYAPVMLCYDCGHVEQCKHCSTTLTYHQREKKLRCHHCDASYTPRHQCPNCEQTLSLQGFGTERIEDNLKAFFPETKIVRIDRDTTRAKNAFNKKLKPAYEGESQILIGTQMLAKGHHFPNVNLVAILNIDSSLFSMDFRALERLGQLLTQVAGRSGRESQDSEAYLQTLNPENPELRFLLSQGYHAFAEKLLEQREAALLPPYENFCLIRASSADPKQALAFLSRCKASIDNSVTAIGPIAAPIERKAGSYRFQLLLQSSQRKALSLAISALIDRINGWTVKNLKWSIDVDPQDFY